VRFGRDSHLTEYAAEALGLGIFMVSACGFAVLLFDPASPVVQAVPAVFPRFLAMGIAMGLTLLIDIYSPWGRRSGAHLNPAVTLAFFRLGKVARRDVVGYVAGQFAGGLLGTGLAVLLFHPWIGDPSVDYAVTVPGAAGVAVAFVAELLISFFLMLTVLSSTSRPKVAPFTGLLAAALVALYITLETPISGMSMNPARTVGSAAFAHQWTALWLYFVAPLAGMLGAAEVFRSSGALWRRACAKFHHDDRFRCIFCEHHAR
jgi:aquaporin Z